MRNFIILICCLFLFSCSDDTPIKVEISDRLIKKVEVYNSLIEKKEIVQSEVLDYKPKRWILSENNIKKFIEIYKYEKQLPDWGSDIILPTSEGPYYSFIIQLQSGKIVHGKISGQEISIENKRYYIINKEKFIKTLEEILKETPVQ